MSNGQPTCSSLGLFLGFLTGVIWFLLAVLGVIPTFLGLLGLVGGIVGAIRLIIAIIGFLAFVLLGFCIFKRAWRCFKKGC